MRAQLLGTLIAILASSGCSSASYLSDDLGGLEVGGHIIEYLSGPLADSERTIHQPYALGTEVQIAANSSSPFMSNDDLSVEVDDTTVLRIDSIDGNNVSCTAISEGETEVYIVDDNGDQINSVSISVRAPSRIELFAAGPVLVGRTGEEARVEDARIVSGGMGTFLVRYFDGETPIFGSHIIQGIDTEEIRVTRQVMGIRGERDLIHVEPFSEGAFDLELSTTEGPIMTFPVEGVNAESMHSFMLLRESTDDTEDGTQRTVLAQGYDEEGLPLYGLSWSWTDEGYVHDELGDLYVYNYYEDGSRTVTATNNETEQEGEITLHSMEAGGVNSSNDLGCSASGRPPSASDAAFMFLMVGAFALARRRTFK